MISKSEALYNLSKAYLDSRVANRLYWDTMSCLESDREYYKTTERFETMRRCYLEADIVSYMEVEDATCNKYKVEKIEPAKAD